MNTLPENSLLTAAVILVSYLSGSVPFGYLIGKIRGIDIRTCGSGNIGATNVTRVIGKTAGRICFALDFLKGALPVIVISLLTPKPLFGFLSCSSFRTLECLPDPAGLLPSVAAFCTVAGHIWPCWLGFRGGKGVSTAAGAVLALNPPAILTAGAVWAVVFYSSRYVSLASILAAAAVPLSACLFSAAGIAHAPVPEIVLFTLIAVLTIGKHSSNIRRLFNGTENRFAKKGKEREEKEDK